MSDEQVGTATTEPEGSATAPGPDASAASSPDPSDFDARLQSDAPFAAKFAKEQQAAASRANARIKQGDLALQIADRMGGGDLAKGGEAALQELMLIRQMRDHPVLKSYIERFQAGQPIEPVTSADSGGSLYGGSESDDDPREQQLRALQGNVARLESAVSLRNAADAFKGFADTEYGKLLEKDELSDVFGAWDAQMRAWSQTPDGRKKLMDGITKDEVEMIALNHLNRSGKLLELGERRARQRTDSLRERETDSPDRLASTRVTRQATTEITAVEALRQAASELGVTLKH